MADNNNKEDEEVELEQEEQTQTTKTQRPERRVELLTHDTRKDKTDAIIELIQGVLDTIQSAPGANNANNSNVNNVNNNNNGGAAAAPVYRHKDVAARIKAALDEKQKGTWHVIVGKHFAANVSHDAETLVNVKIDGVYYLLLRSGPPERPLTQTDAAEEGGRANDD